MTGSYGNTTPLHESPFRDTEPTQAPSKNLSTMAEAAGEVLEGLAAKQRGEESRVLLPQGLAERSVPRKLIGRTEPESQEDTKVPPSGHGGWDCAASGQKCDRGASGREGSPEWGKGRRLVTLSHLPFDLHPGLPPGGTREGNEDVGRTFASSKHGRSRTERGQGTQRPPNCDRAPGRAGPISQAGCTPAPP